MPWSKTAVLVLVALALLGSAPPVSAVTQDAFLLRSGADIVALCSTPSDDPLYTAAVHMCHGFGAGTYQTIMAMTRHEKIARVLCPPEPPASRNEVVQQFLGWAKQNQGFLAEPAVETVGRFLLSQYPCRKP